MLAPQMKPVQVFARRMQTIVWSGLFIFACWYPVTAEVPVQPNFDAERFAGRWYPIRLVMNPDGETKEVAIVGRMAVAKPNGDIDMDMEALENGECVTKMTTFLHTTKPGVFTTDAGNTIRVVETDYKTFHTLHVDTKTYKVLHLEVRDLGNHEDRINKFKLLAASLGFSEDKIVKVPRTGSCLK